MVRKILEEKIVTVNEVKDILDKLKKKGDKIEFDSFQEGTLEYCNRFAKLDDIKKVEKIRKMLLKEYENLDEHHIAMIINILPNTVEELRVIFEKDLKLSKLDDDTLQEMIYKIQDII